VGNGGGFKAGLIVVLCAAMFCAASSAAAAGAGNGHSGGSGPSAGGQHGQDCPPGFHDTSAGTCEHNGGGGGNCGDNQSGNDNGLGNNGNDNGFGHKGDVCDPGNLTPPPPGPPTPPGPPGPPGPPAPPGSPPSGGTPTQPSAPSVTCAASLRLGRKHVAVGRRTLLAIRVTDARKAPLHSMRVVARGAGVRLSVTTDSSGRARLAIRPLNAGAIRITVAQASTCSSVSGLVLATAVAKAHKPNFTG
jgi:hypothetical protein